MRKISTLQELTCTRLMPVNWYFKRAVLVNKKTLASKAKNRTFFNRSGAIALKESKRLSIFKREEAFNLAWKPYIKKRAMRLRKDGCCRF